MEEVVDVNSDDDKIIQAQQSDGKLYDDCLFLHFLRSHETFPIVCMSTWYVLE